MNSSGNSTIRLLIGPFTVGWLWLATVGASAQTDGLLDRWIAAQANLHTWSADIIETRTFKTLSEPLVSTGKVWMAMPNHFRWELGQPAQTIAVRQPDRLLLIYPRLKRVERYPLTNAHSGPWRDAMALLEASFPRSRTKLESQFEVVSMTESNSVANLSLRPRSPLARKFVTSLQISFQATDFSPVSTTLTFSDGSSMRNDFTNAVRNPPLPKGLFDVKSPPSFTVVEPLQK
jgi:outer membrane lipoprotein-sorting protein